MTVVQFKDIAQAAQAVLTSAAIVVGAVWFFWRRVRFPCATLSHLVTSRPLRDGKVLVRVTIRAKNSGVVLIKPESIAVRINQVCPIHPHLADQNDFVRVHRSEADWPIISERTNHLAGHEIEPGEPDEFHFDFELETAVKTVLAYSYLKNSAKKKRWLLGKAREIGWNTTTIHDLDHEPEQARSS